MQDRYVTDGSIGREELFYYRLLEGFNFSTYSGKSYSRDGKRNFLKRCDTLGKVGQCKYMAIVDSEGAVKRKKTRSIKRSI